MPRSTELIGSALLALAALGFSGGALAQAVQPGQSQGSQASGPAKAVVDDPAPGQQSGGIKGQNIFDVKPEVKRDASSDPGYMEQNNAQRNAVREVRGRKAIVQLGILPITVDLSDLIVVEEKQPGE